MLNRALMRSACLAGLLIISTPVLAAKHKVDVVNKTDVAIATFRASEVTTDDWEEDLLGDSLLNPGETLEVTFDTTGGGCLYDFRALFVDDDEVISNNVNVCTTTVFEFTLE